MCMAMEIFKNIQFEVCYPEDAQTFQIHVYGGILVHVISLDCVQLDRSWIFRFYEWKIKKICDHGTPHQL